MRAWLALLALSCGSALAAQADPRGQLAWAKAQAEQSRQRVSRMDAMAKRAADVADRSRAEQAAVAARVQASEAAIAAARARLALIETRRRLQERRLAQRQQPIVRLTAALQTMARRPTVATLAQPGSLDDMVHVRALMSTLTPRIQAQAAGLQGEVRRTRVLRRAAALALADLRADQARLRDGQRRLAAMETAARSRSARFASSARLEAQRAAQLAETSRDLQSLVGTLDADAALRDRLASLPGPLPRQARPTSALPDDLAPSDPRALRIRLPAIGPVVRGYGEMLPSGARSRSVVIGSANGALVVAPASGRVTFAGLFRGYGAIVILDHGQGFTSLITGLASNLARVGDPVVQGSPIGRAGTAGIAIELRQDGRVVDVSQFVA